MEEPIKTDKQNKLLKRLRKQKLLSLTSDELTEAERASMPQLVTDGLVHMNYSPWSGKIIYTLVVKL